MRNHSWRRARFFRGSGILLSRGRRWSSRCSASGLSGSALSAGGGRRSESSFTISPALHKAVGTFPRLHEAADAAQVSGMPVRRDVAVKSLSLPQGSSVVRSERGMRRSGITGATRRGSCRESKRAGQIICGRHLAGLGGHPKAANDGRLKSGQRSEHTGH